MPMKPVFLIHLTTLLLSLVPCTQAISLWNTTGPYHVGYTQHVLNHTTPNDITKPGTFMLLTIYYPTLQVPKTSVPYLDSTSAFIFESTIGFTSGCLSQLTTNLQLQAPTLTGTNPAFKNGTSPFPTLFFTPGAGLPASSYTAYLTELASIGYAVVAIDHPGEAPYLPLPSPFINGSYGYPDFTEFPPTLADIFAVLNYRVSDVSAAISSGFFPALVRQFGWPFNLTHFGIFGHSIGGAAAAAVMAVNDKDAELFKAGVNLDGTFFQFADMEGNINTSVPAPDLKRPFLEMTSEGHFEGNASAPGDDSFKYFNDAQTGWLRDIQVNGTRHLDFSDIPLWFELLDKSPESNNLTWVGRIGGQRVTEVVNKMLKSLFDSLGGRNLEVVDQVVATEPELFLLAKNDPGES